LTTDPSIAFVSVFAIRFFLFFDFLATEIYVELRLIRKDRMRAIELKDVGCYFLILLLGYDRAFMVFIFMH
jgi:hypothetical protein